MAAPYVRGMRLLPDAVRRTCAKALGLPAITSTGGYAEFAVVNEQFAYPIPDVFSDQQAPPLLCAGIIGYRSLKRSGLRQR